MKSSLFARLMASYLGVGVISLLLVGLISSFFLRTYFYNVRETELIQKGDRIAHVMSDLLRPSVPRQDIQHISILLDNLINARVIITDTQGNMIASSMSGMDNMKHWNGRVSVAEIADSLKGKIKIYRNYDPASKGKLFNITIPIYTNNEVTGIVLIHAPYETTNEIVLRVMGQFFLAALLAIILTAILGFILSKRVSRPLQEMNRITRSMAKGDFNVRLDVPYKDEVGQLADSINHLATELDQTIHELVKEKNLKDKFVEDVSHELRSPLTLIRGYVDAIVEGVAKEETKDRYLQIVSRETNRLNRLVTDLLDFTHLKKKDLSLGDIHLFDLIHDTAAKMEPEAARKELQWELSVSDGLKVRGHQDRLEQVLMNLLDNAIRYTPNGGTIRIEAVPEGKLIRITVQDTGVGIPDDHLQAIWERFHKVDPARTKTEGGTGLGLAIAKEIVELHGGTVDVSSQQGKGSTFSFTLPKSD